MQSSKLCILGQLYSHYNKGIALLWPVGAGDWSADHGFTADAADWSPNGGWDNIPVEMADLWRAEVRARLGADAGGASP